MISPDLWTAGNFVCVGVWFLFLVLFQRRLRYRHEAAWRELGEPTLFHGYSPRDTWALVKFLYLGRPLKLGDRTLALLGIVLCILLPVALTWMLGPLWGGVRL